MELCALPWVTFFLQDTNQQAVAELASRLSAVTVSIDDEERVDNSTFLFEDMAPYVPHMFTLRSQA